MRKVLSICALMLLVISDLHGAEYLVEKGKRRSTYCGYKLENLKLEIIKSTRELLGEILVYKLIVGFDFDGEVKVGELRFSCYMRKEVAAEPVEVYRKKTVAAEIESEDSGGRYFRLIAWDKVMTGRNWKGTVAYVREIYGDHQKISVPDFFYMCPELLRLTCFSLTFLKEGSLELSEANAIPETLSKITIQ